MNPNEAIRPWLLGCGKYFGANEAHEYRWADAEDGGRPEVMYFTYRLKAARPSPGRVTRRDKKVGDYDVLKRGEHQWIVDVEITLHNDPSGVDDLACCVMALSEQEFINLGRTNNAAFERLVGDIEDETDDSQADRVYHRHRMVCRFSTKLGYEHLRKNEVVTNVVLDDPFSQED